MNWEGRGRHAWVEHYIRRYILFKNTQAYMTIEPNFSEKSTNLLGVIKFSLKTENTTSGTVIQKKQGFTLVYGTLTVEALVGALLV